MKKANRISVFCLAFFILILFQSFDKKIVQPSLFEKGTVFNYTFTGTNGEIQGIAEVKVVEVFIRNDKTFSVSKVKWKTKEHGKLKSEFHFEKTKDAFISELINLIPPNVKHDQLQHVSVHGNPIVYPIAPSYEKTLSGDSIFIQYESKNKTQSSNYIISDRRIFAADTSLHFQDFPLWKVTYTESIRSPEMAPNIPSRTRYVEELYSPELGVVEAIYRVNGVIEQKKRLTKVECH